MRNYLHILIWINLEKYLARYDMIMNVAQQNNNIDVQELLGPERFRQEGDR
jgi:hypothetical protein